jgi:hypothetical protein
MSWGRRGILQAFCAAVVLSAIDIFGLDAKDCLEPPPQPAPSLTVRAWRMVPCSDFHPSYEGHIFTNVDPQGYNPDDAQRIFNSDYPVI